MPLDRYLPRKEKLYLLNPRTQTALTSSPNPSTHGQAVTFTAVVTSYLGVPPDGETVSFMKAQPYWVPGR